MTDLKLRVLGVVSAVALSAHCLAADITRPEAEALLLECQNQRQQHLVLGKEKAIDDCINIQHRDRDYCERFNADYGERIGAIPGLYWDLPVCEKAVAVEKYFNMNPRKQVYSTS